MSTQTVFFRICIRQEISLFNIGVLVFLNLLYGEVLVEGGFTRNVIERRAIEIKDSDIVRFTNELNPLAWSNDNLVFLDEVSFDNRGMIRERVYSIKGTNVLIRGEFVGVQHYYNGRYF